MTDTTAGASSTTPPPALTNSLKVNSNDDSTTKSAKIRMQTTVDTLQQQAYIDTGAAFASVPRSIGV